MENKERIRLFNIDEIMQIIPSRLTTVGGVAIRTDSLTLRCFKRHGTRCWLCGRKADYFALEYSRKNDKFFLNLYCIHNGKEILYTKDHIFPKSFGGKNSLTNLRTACYPCNHGVGSIFRDFTGFLNRLKTNYGIYGNDVKEIDKVSRSMLVKLIFDIEKIVISKSKII